MMIESTLKTTRILSAILVSAESLINSRVPESVVIEHRGRQISVRPSDSMQEVVITFGVDTDRHAALNSKKRAIMEKLSQNTPKRDKSGAVSDKASLSIYKELQAELEAVNEELDTPPKATVKVISVSEILSMCEEMTISIMSLNSSQPEPRKKRSKPPQGLATVAPETTVEEPAPGTPAETE